jgi:hypothetical protein
MVIEPWIVRTALVVAAINLVNVVLFLVARRVQNRATSATRNADKPVIVSPAVAQPSTAAYAAASDTQIRRLAS